MWKSFFVLSLPFALVFVERALVEKMPIDRPKTYEKGASEIAAAFVHILAHTHAHARSENRTDSTTLHIDISNHLLNRHTHTHTHMYTHVRSGFAGGVGNRGWFRVSCPVGNSHTDTHTRTLTHTYMSTDSSGGWRLCSSGSRNKKLVVPGVVSFVYYGDVREAEE